jgi:hypothetical protein
MIMTATDLRERYEWRKVETPKAWRPKELGEELLGFYGGKTSRSGPYGQYDLVLVHVPKRGSFLVSGTRVIQLIDAAGIEPGWPVRVVFRGVVQLDEQRRMKSFDVFVAEGDPVSPDELPRTSDQEARA